MAPHAQGLVAERLGALRGRRSFAELATSLRTIGPSLATYVLPFVIVVYLALEGGGYDAIVHSEVGIALWWILLLAALTGVLPLARIGNAGWIGLGLLVVFAAWTGLGISWSESSERSVAELARVATYAGVLALALAVQGWGAARRMAMSLVAAIAFVGGLALLSRLHPDWFPANETAQFLPAAQARLNYPLNYWNGLAALMAISVPLTLWAATNARRVIGQALAASVLPILILTLLYTFSRGGATELAIGVAIFVGLYPHRLAILPTLLTTGAGGTILVVAATQRDALEDNRLTAAAGAQGDEMLAMTAVVCVGVGLLQVAIALAQRHGIGPRIKTSQAAARVSIAVALASAVVVAIASGLPGFLSDTWQEFKQPQLTGSGLERFESAGGNGRYQLWEAAADANATDPLTGIGPGTFEYWWAEHGTIRGFVRDAHSLYLETLGELGIVGLLLVGGFVLFVLSSGMLRAVRAEPERRALLAAATAGCAVFAAATAIDWVWELAVLPVTFMLLAGVVIGPATVRRQPRGYRRRASVHRTRSRIAFSILAGTGIIAIAIPLAAANYLQGSSNEFQSSRIDRALDKAEAARTLQPYAAAPRLQEALILESARELDAAAIAARNATRGESTNWRTWLVLSRIEAKRGNVEASIEAYRQAESLNPRSPLFVQ